MVVLVASSDAARRGEIAARLAALWRVAEATDLASALAAMASEPRVVVVDVPLPGSEGPGVIADLRARAPYCPVVALVAPDDAALAGELAGRAGIQVLDRSASRGTLGGAVAAALAEAAGDAAALAARDAIFGALREGVLVHSPTGRLVRCNQVAAELLGVREGDAFAAHFHRPGAVLIAEDGARLSPQDLAIPKVVATRRPSGAQVFQVRSGEQRRWLNLESRPLLDAQGELYAVVSSVRDVTERMEASADLAAAERRQYLLFEHTSEGYLVLDRAGRIIEASPPAERVLHRPIVPGSDAARLIHLFDRARFHALLIEVRGEGAGHLSAELRVGEGDEDRPSWLEVTLSNRLDEPTVAGIVVNLRDVTERRRKDESLARLSAIVEDSGDAIVSETLEGAITSWNAAAERLFGYRAEEMVGESSLVVVPEPARAGAIALRRKIRAGEPYAPTIETTRRRKDGRIVDVAVSASPVRNRGGQLIGISWITRDITERRRLERERRQAVERFRLGFERAAIGMAMIDHDEVVRRVNPALCKLLGRSPGEVVGHRAGEFVHRDDLAARNAQLERVRSGEQHHYRNERRLVRADGQVTWVLIDVVDVQEDETTAPYLFVQLQDITDRKHMEAELAHQARHDTLTGLPNRTQLSEALDQALSRAEAEDRAMALVFVDLDGFKVVNDRFGHRRGDRLLGEIAQRLVKAAHPNDTVARLGGDEFVVICEHVEDAAGALGLGEAIASHFDAPFGEEALVVRASCGVLVTSGALSADEALECADAAMYEAKADGGGKARLYERPLAVPQSLFASGL